MKKLILASAMLLTAIGVYAQGTVTFVNNAATVVTLGGAPVQAGTTFSINLYYAVDSATAPADSAFAAIGNPVNFLTPGRFNGGIRTTPATTQPGQAAWFQARAWETSFGNSYETAVAAGAIRVGQSEKFKLTVGSPTGTPTPLTSAGGFTGLVIVPEPSVIALSVLGLAGLLVLRRRRSN